MAFRRAKERKVKIFIGHLPDRVNNCSLRLGGGFPKTIALIGSIPAVAQADPSYSKESPEYRLGAVQTKQAALIGCRQVQTTVGAAGYLVREGLWDSRAASV